MDSGYDASEPAGAAESGGRAEGGGSSRSGGSVAGRRVGFIIEVPETVEEESDDVRQVPETVEEKADMRQVGADINED